jgi:hypothetical protein
VVIKEPMALIVRVGVSTQAKFPSWLSIYHPQFTIGSFLYPVTIPWVVAENVFSVNLPGKIMD